MANLLKPHDDPADNTYSGDGTVYATPKDLWTFADLKKQGKSDSYANTYGDSGIGSPSLGKISTANTYGVAAPRDYLIKHFGADYDAKGNLLPDQPKWRTARAQVTINGNTFLVPITDIGPGTGQLKDGVVTDLTQPFHSALNLPDRFSGVTVSYIPNAGPDYKKDPDGFYTEQAAIGRALQSAPGSQIATSGYGALSPGKKPWLGSGVPLSATPNPTPLNPQISPPSSQVAAPIVPRAQPAVPRATLIAPAQPIAPAVNQMGGYPQPPPPAAPGLPPWGYGAPPPWGQTPSQ
jgi:hypothetical protein